MHTDPFASDDHLYTQHGFRKGPIATRQERKKWLEEYITFIKEKRVDLLAKIKQLEHDQEESKSWDFDGDYFWILDTFISARVWTIDAQRVTEEQILKLLSNM